MAGEKDNLKALVVSKVVAKTGVTKDFVYKVTAGDRENETILDEFFDLKTRIEDAVDDYMNTPLMAAVKELVPFNQ